MVWALFFLEIMMRSPAKIHSKSKEAVPNLPGGRLQTEADTSSPKLSWVQALWQRTNMNRES